MFRNRLFLPLGQPKAEGMSVASFGSAQPYEPSIADRKPLVPRLRPTSTMKFSSSGLNLDGTTQDMPGLQPQLSVGPSGMNQGYGSSGSIGMNNSVSSPTVYVALKIIGQGSFGSVILAREKDGEDFVAIKKVLQDRRYKNRELEIMQKITLKPHPNVILLKQSFESKGSSNNTSGNTTSQSNNRGNQNKRGTKQPQTDEVYLHLVLEYIPETLYSLNKYYRKQRMHVMPNSLTKLYFFQLLRALAHIHGMNICHRDIKPENVLVDPVKNIVKLCDFGSSKVLIPNEPNIAYICSRFYRAPELILGNANYNTAVDVWSAGCVLAEMLQGTPLFPGSSNVDQLVEIIKILGTPSKEQLVLMNPGHTNFKLPPLQVCLWNSILPHASEEAIELLQKILKYVPSERLSAIDACCVAYFEEIRSPSYLMPNGLPISNSMQSQFTSEELKLASQSTVDLLVNKIVHPPEAEEDLTWKKGSKVGAGNKGRNGNKVIDFSDD